MRRRCSHFATWKPDELNERHPSCCGEAKSASGSSARTLTHTHSRAKTHGAHTRTLPPPPPPPWKNERGTERGTQTSNSPMWKAEVWGYLLFFLLGAPFLPPLSLSFYLSQSFCRRVWFLWESCSARREVWLFAWSAEEEEEKTRVKSGGRWSAAPLGEEACCASWRSVSALRPRRAKPGFTPTTGQSG